MSAIKVKLHEGFNKFYRSFGRFLLRRRLLELKPLCPQVRIADADTVCVVMGTRRTSAQHVFTSYLWRRFLPKSIPVIMVCDAELDSHLRRMVETLFSGAECVMDAQSLLSTIHSNKIKQFIHTQRFGRKFLSLFGLSQSHNVIYSDDDILVFREPTELMEAGERQVSCLYSPDVSGVPYLMHMGMVSAAAKRGVAPLADFQAGLMYVRRGVIKEESVEQLLSDWTPANDVHFSEQTLFSLLFSSLPGGDILPAQRYINDPARGRFFGGHDVDYTLSQPVLRHYMGTVRHRYFQMASALLREHSRD